MKWMILHGFPVAVKAFLVDIVAVAKRIRFMRFSFCSFVIVRAIGRDATTPVCLNRDTELSIVLRMGALLSLNWVRQAR